MRAARLTLLTKSLRPLPEKWHGLKRRRASVPAALPRPGHEPRGPRARRRSQQDGGGASARMLDERDFVEVETPVLQAVPGGADGQAVHDPPQRAGHRHVPADRPGAVPEAAAVGGLERVYEIGRKFRNEGISPKYNPEFTMLEAYQAFGSIRGHDGAHRGPGARPPRRRSTARVTFTCGGPSVDLAKPWRRTTLAELVSEATGEDVSLDSRRRLRAVADRHDVGYDPEWGAGQAPGRAVREARRERLIEPTFVIGFPREVSPLARTHRDDPRLTEHFDLIMGGSGDRARPTRSSPTPTSSGRGSSCRREQKEAGEEETHPYDEEFLVALEHGMPPAGGHGARRRPAVDDPHRRAVAPGDHPVPRDASRGVDDAAPRCRAPPPRGVHQGSPRAQDEPTAAPTMGRRRRQSASRSSPPRAIHRSSFLNGMSVAQVEVNDAGGIDGRLLETTLLEGSEEEASERVRTALQEPLPQCS